MDTPQPRTQGELFGPGALGSHRRLRWQGHGSGCHRCFGLLRGEAPAGLVVRHCGHPTALRPWYLPGHDAPAFARLADAQAAALEIYSGA